MNFYRLRVINTVFLFFIGIMIGFYFASQKRMFVRVFGSSDYKPVYYGRPEAQDYRPVYIKTENRTNATANTAFNIENNSGEERRFVENIVNQNPIEDDYDFVLVASSDLKQQEDVRADLGEFVKSPGSFVAKKVYGRMILLRGDKNEKVKLYFLYGTGEQAFYIDITDEDNVIKRFDPFRIGYYYNVLFLSKDGSLKTGNKLLSIEETQAKESWASGVPAF